MQRAAAGKEILCCAALCCVVLYVCMFHCVLLHVFPCHAPSLCAQLKARLGINAKAVRQACQVELRRRASHSERVDAGARARKDRSEDEDADEDADEDKDEDEDEDTTSDAENDDDADTNTPAAQVL